MKYIIAAVAFVWAFLTVLGWIEYNRNHGPEIVDDWSF